MKINYGSDYYDNRRRSPAFQSEIQNIIKLINPLENDLILEIGCGGGVLLEELSKFQCDLVVGSDWLITATKLSSSKLDIPIISCDARKLPFRKNRFTKIIAQHLIEHFSDPVTVLKEWSRVLTDNGRIVLVTPNLGYPYQDWFEDPTHFKIYTSEELSRIVCLAGFNVESIQIINPFLFHWRFQSLANKKFQFLNNVSFLSKHGMSIVILASKIN